jgi:hypothetical protein
MRPELIVDDEDGLKPFRGLANGIALSVPIWLVIGLVIWRLLK